MGLKSLRLLKGLSQEELALAAGLQAAQISRYETGKAKPSFRTIHRICDVLGCAADDLFLPEMDLPPLRNSVEGKYQEVCSFLLRKGAGASVFQALRDLYSLAKKVGNP